MIRVGWLALAVLIAAQAGCASHREVDAARPAWPCRVLDGSSPVTVQKQQSQTGAGAMVLGVLVAWPILAGACLVSRS